MKPLLAAMVVALALAAPAAAGTAAKAVYLHVGPGQTATFNGSIPNLDYMGYVYVNDHLATLSSFTPKGHVGIFYSEGSAVRLWLRGSKLTVTAVTTDPGGVSIRVRLVRASLHNLLQRRSS